MKKKFALGITVLLSALLTACASTPTTSNVIQKENNQFEATGLGKTSVISKNNAVAAANKTCKKMPPIVVNENTEYSGSFKDVAGDQVGQMIQAAADVIGSLAGKNTSIATDSDYQTTLTFYCKAN